MKATRTEYAPALCGETGSRFWLRREGVTVRLVCAVRGKEDGLYAAAEADKALAGAESLSYGVEGEATFSVLDRAVALHVLRKAEEAGLAIEWSGFPEWMPQVHQLSGSPRERAEEETEGSSVNWIAGLGAAATASTSGAIDVMRFTGDWVLSLCRLMCRQSVFPWREFGRVFRSVTTNALPIVSAISFLVGLIISFLGSVVLRRFGAEFAVAYLVGFGMLREMGAVMTGIIMAGRTGAAFAAHLGSMKVNEEIDALTTFGIPPIDYLVLPRLLAMAIAMPLLTLYANIVGILSGCLVSGTMMNVPPNLYFNEMQAILGAEDFFLGLFKALIFGVLVGTSGCLRGLQCGSGADAVGFAATRAVVTGITLIILANAIIDWVAASFGI